MLTLQVAFEYTSKKLTCKLVKEYHFIKYNKYLV